MLDTLPVVVLDNLLERLDRRGYVVLSLTCWWLHYPAVHKTFVSSRATSVDLGNRQVSPPANTTRARSLPQSEVRAIPPSLHCDHHRPPQKQLVPHTLPHPEVDDSLPLAERRHTGRKMAWPNLFNAS
jgi:hypothetical protein